MSGPGSWLGEYSCSTKVSVTSRRLAPVQLIFWFCLKVSENSTGAPEFPTLIPLGLRKITSLLILPFMIVIYSTGWQGLIRKSYNPTLHGKKTQTVNKP